LCTPHSRGSCYTGHLTGSWERRSLGYGAHGERVYDWTAVALDPAELPDGWGHWLLVRQQVEPTEGKTTVERAYYRCAGPAQTPLRELIRVAGTRWAIEECFQTAKNEAGLDHYQVRTWRAWYAHITLALLAAGYLAVTRAAEHDRPGRKRGSSTSRDAHHSDSDGGDDELIPLTANEIRRLLAHLVLAPIHRPNRRLSWSRWRRRRQYQARRCHYRRRGQTPPP
jgi:hypothetical protein